MSHTKPSRKSNLLHNSRGGAAAEKVVTSYYREIEIPVQPPNVIARLMGIDAIPTPPPKPTAAATIIQAHPTSSLKPPSSHTISAASETKVVSPFRQAKCSLLSMSYRNRNTNTNGDSSSRHCLNKMRRSRSRRRHHPQEDLLQKIKHDFQAWQAHSDDPLLDGSRRIQMIAQENLRKQKMARYGFASSKVQKNEKDDSERAVPVSKVAPDEPKPCQGTVITLLRASPAGAAASEKFRDFEAGKNGHDDHSASDEKLRSPAPIVLLKPCSDVVDVNGQQPAFGLPKLKRDADMSRFLQEVKEMLQKQLKAASATTSDLNTTAWGTAEPKQITRVIAKQTKETVTKDLSKRLSRSESFRAFRSDRKRKEATTTTKLQASPEHVRILTRKDDDEKSMSSCSITSRERVRSLADVVSPSPSGFDIGFGEQSFRSECPIRHKDDSLSSARALLRSFSAPESSFSLFGDGSARSSTHEASQGHDAAMTSTNSTAFGFIRGLRNSFSLRRNLFRKTSLGLGEARPQMAIGTAPLSPETFNLFKVAQANLTELPPSPVSPLEVVGHSCRHLFSDLNCTFPELSPKCLSEFEAPASELSYKTDITLETACNQDKAYIREVLVAAGLYDDGSLDNKANARVDSMARPICDDTFEEVEDIYYYRGNYCDDAIGMYSGTGGNAADHRMLFDLANEALQSLVQAAKPGSSLQQWVIDSTGVSRGRRLVDDVWQQVQTLRNPQMQEMQTIDSMVAYEIRKSWWAEVLYEDVYVVGRKVERAIFDELIEDLLVETFHSPDKPEQIARRFELHSLSFDI
ncbi:unnamed protein product [Urochloa decumbens]|uniref:DUF4378 domain-containing protein n=1 Tax=Urochloa decumbens TaxID=240449 RepID=A0ABC9E1V5_9POAL